MTITINGSGTITGLSAGGLPDATIQQADLATNVAGNGPAFSAYLNSSQTPSNATWTKVTINAEEFDTNNNFDKDTNYRFQPTVAGYYQINGAVYWSTQSTSIVGLYKNGLQYKSANIMVSIGLSSAVSSLVYLNGSTDYVELYVYLATGSALQNGATYQTWFNGAMVRAA